MSNKNYENVVFLGDFNTCINDSASTFFCSLNDRLTFHKNPEKPTCIDLILTTRPDYFHQNNVFKTGLYDFHMVVVTELKLRF